jgi:ribokinase
MPSCLSALSTSRSDPIHQSQSSNTAMSTPTICVPGFLNIELVYYLPHHPLPGDTHTASKPQHFPSGKKRPSPIRQPPAQSFPHRAHLQDAANVEVTMARAVVSEDAHGTTTFWKPRILTEVMGSEVVRNEKTVSRTCKAASAAGVPVLTNSAPTATLPDEM